MALVDDPQNHNVAVESGSADATFAAQFEYTHKRLSLTQ